MMSHKKAGGSVSGAHSCVPLVASEQSSSGKQFIAERGIEYGYQFVTPKILNSPDCLYLKKSCKFLQSYEKTREEKRKRHFFSLPDARWQKMIL